MKIRNGFVSNSSSSSFILVALPDNFDPEVYVDYLNEKNKKNKKRTFGVNAVSLLRVLMKRGRVAEDEEDGFDEVYDATYGLAIYHGESPEGYGYVEVASKKILDRIQKINIEYESEKMKSATIQIREKREKLKMKYKHIDPYGEEDWGEEEDDVKEGIIKKYNNFINE